MNKKLTTLLLAFLIMIIGKSEAATITQKLGDSAITSILKSGQEVTLNFINRTNYTFKKWEVEKGNVTINTTSKNVTFTMPNEDVIIRANYEEETPTVATCTLTYNANGGSGAPSGQTVTATKDGYTFTISSIKPVKSGYTFVGWSTSSSATTASYSAGESITLSANTTLYAVWEQRITTYTLTYNANGGSGAPSSQTGTALIISSIEPTRDGYIFVGWSKNSSATVASYSAGESITLSANATLYAIWKVEKPTLAPNSRWYKGTTDDRSTILEIEIVDSYTPTGLETASWNADVGNIGAIKCYIEGTKLTIAGNGTGQIYANADSSYMFGGHWEYGRYIVGNPFNNVTSIKGLNLLNTSKVEDMCYMFDACSSLTNLDLSSLNTSSVTNMECMFVDCSSLTNLDVSNFDTSRVTSMYAMFAGCSSLANLNLSNFDTSNVTVIYNMFNGCSSLESLDLSNFDTSSVTTIMYNMFNGCSSLTNLDVSGFDTSNVTGMYAMFAGCSSLANLNLSNFDTSNVTDMSGMFNGCSSLANLDLSNFDTSSVTSMYDMFNGCSSLESLDLSNFDTSSVVSMYAMFAGCSSLTNLDVSNFDTSSVTSMGNMFNGCSSLTNLNLSSFNTSKVMYMDSMFKDCSGLKMLDLSNFDTRGVYRYYLPNHYITEFSITDMFSGITSLNRITLGVNFTFNGDGSGTDDYAAKLPDGKWYKEGTTEYWDNGQPEEGTRTVTTTYVKK